MKAWRSTSHEPCPSCEQLNGQVHTEEQWQTFGVKPKDHSLYCKEKCSCHFEETNEPEQGDLSSVPLRAQARSNHMPNPRNTEVRLSAFNAKPEKTLNGYKVLVIHAGIARPITGGTFHFSPTLLKHPDTVKLWEGINCFADHDLNGESVKELAGVYSNPVWDEQLQGIVAELRPTGAAAYLVYLYGEEMLGAFDQHPDMGFSPVIIFTAEGEEVTKIIRCRSTDMVINPAFENANFIAQFQGADMKKKYLLPDGTTAEYEEGQQPEGATLQTTLSAMSEITGAMAKIKESTDGAKEMHLASCQQLLTTSLDAQLELPEEAKKIIRGRFQNRTFTVEELKTEIDQFNAAFAKQNENNIIKGPSQITGMFSSEDQLQAAMDDLLGAPREKGAENLKVHKFSGIREAYLMLTNDYGFVGDVAPTAGRFQGTTANFPNLVANVLNKAIVANWTMLGKAGYNWWEKITTIEHFETLQQIRWLRLGTIASLPTVLEGAEYTELALGDNGETSSFTKYGGFLSFTLEAMDRDDTRKLRAAPREIANAAIRNISEQIAAIFTSNSGAGPTLADTGALFNATAVTTTGGHANLLTTALGTDYNAWNTVAAAMYNQPLLVSNAAGDNVLTYGKKQALEPTIFLGPRALKVQAESLFIPRWDAPAQNVPATQAVTWGGRVDPVTVPEWTDATDWAAVIDPMLLPGVMLGERYGVIPKVVIAGDQRDPAMFMNDESRLKVRHFLSVGIGNWSALHKSNVGG